MSKEGDLASVQFCFTHHQATRQRQSDPTVFDHIHGKPRFSGGEIAIDFQIVIDATERRFNWRRPRLSFEWKGRMSQRRVFIYRQHYPAICRGWGLSQAGSSNRDYKER